MIKYSPFFHISTFFDKYILYYVNGDYMNAFKIILEYIILLSFPTLVYLIYLFTNKNINSKCIYFGLSLLSSIYLVRCFGSNILMSFLVLSIVVIISYIYDYFILAIILSVLVIVMHTYDFNNAYILGITYILLLVLYKFKVKKPIYLELSLLISLIIYILWVYEFNSIYFNSNLIIISICYVFISNIFYLMCIEGNKILKVHLDYKELKKDEQVHLSLFKITHEIKNPIAVCKGYLDMININDKEQVNRFIPIIKSEIKRLLVILEDFLSINKINNNSDIMDINMLVEDIIDKFKDNKNIEIKNNLIDDEVYINGDYNRLNQMFINIIKNSVESINKNGKINIKSYMRKKDYIITIEDNGIGMNKEVLKKMKEPFYTTKSRGTGLGIPLIYEIASSNKIKIEYSSKENIGTKVILKFKRI